MNTNETKTITSSDNKNLNPNESGILLIISGVFFFLFSIGVYGLEYYFFNTSNSSHIIFVPVGMFIVGIITFLRGVFKVGKKISVLEISRVSDYLFKIILSNIWIERTNFLLFLNIVAIFFVGLSICFVIPNAANDLKNSHIDANLYTHDPISVDLNLNSIGGTKILLIRNTYGYNVIGTGPDAYYNDKDIHPIINMNSNVNP